MKDLIATDKATVSRLVERLKQTRTRSTSASSACSSEPRWAVQPRRLRRFWDGPLPRCMSSTHAGPRRAMQSSSCAGAAVGITNT